MSIDRKTTEIELTKEVTERVYYAIDPRTGGPLDPPFFTASVSDVDGVLRLAAEAFQADRARPNKVRKQLLEGIADEIESLGDVLIERACLETALDETRLRGERTRTINQLRLFAGVVGEGSWVEARIDRADPGRKPVPRPDLRRMLVPMGPVVVFGASNFPLAFSVAGGDTASALAAGCPVVCKAHPAHPGTSELVAGAIRKAVYSVGFHPGTFALVHAADPEISRELVRHPLTRAVGFTGSFKVGRSLFDLAAARPEPIPVYAEMGSTNPLFLLPGALEERAETLADGFVQSVTLGAGQFCTNPGLVFATESPGLDTFLVRVADRLTDLDPYTMLTPGICSTYARGVSAWEGMTGLKSVVHGIRQDQVSRSRAVVFTTDLHTFETNPELQDEVFGPASLVVICKTTDEQKRAARLIRGNLTATVHGTQQDLEGAADLLAELEQRAGRLILNGFPTGVEVSHAMQHGGPYPATTDARSTSVGTAAITRFARPVCYQGFPDELLPPELKNDNPLGIWRMLDGKLSQDQV